MKNQISIKIGDLGVAKDRRYLMTTMVGTPFYMSPEILNNQAYSAKTDVW